MLLRLFTLAMLLPIALSGCASPPKSRPEAQATLTRLWDADAPARSYDEYLSVEEAYVQAEAFLKKNNSRMAENYYRLALVKGRLLEEQIAGKGEKLVLSTSGSPSAVQVRVPSGESLKKFPSGQDGEGQSVPYSVPTAVAAEPGRPIVSQPLPARQGEAGFDPEVQEDASREPKAVGETERAQSHFPSRVIKSDRIIGGEECYVVEKGDTLGLIGARLGVSWRYLAKINNLDPKKYLYEGQELRVVNRKIVPKRIRNGLVINIPDRMMYYFKQGRLTKSIPVALGRPNTRDIQEDDVVWHTPTGVFRILTKEKDPVWRVPPSIQKEMEKQGKEVVTRVPPGEKNPLGRYALRTSIPGIMIHSTIRPASIYGFSSHGCIRVSPGMMEDLFDEVEVNTRGEIIYDPIKVAVTKDGRVFLEVNRDIYDKKIDFEKEVKEALRKNRATGKVDWKKVNLVLRSKLGIAEDVTM
ncbi:MAG: hypothetical protein CXR31_12295 [Geobacter sp.]|nr:MAG: hypothetical protein CXR31_12295 [Geobacter sp.]